MKRSNKILLASLLCGQALMIGGCGGSGNGNTNNDDPNPTPSVGLPEALTLSLINASTGAYYSFNTSTETLTNLNEAASASQDSAVQKLQITDTSVIGHFLHWPDFRVANDEEHTDMKYVLMNPGYTSGSPIDADQFSQLVHFHDEALAAHSNEEFRAPEPGSDKAAGLGRLNTFVTQQSELEEEVGEAMPDGETLCRAFVDPYLQFELAEEEHAEEEASEENAEEAHEHGDLIHYALSDSGRMYFFKEGENGLEQTQAAFVKLDDTSSITDCKRTTIARSSEYGVLVFIPDTQKIYLIDSHEGADFHQHSTWALSTILPEGVSADLVAIIGSEEEHDHEHE